MLGAAKKRKRTRIRPPRVDNKNSNVTKVKTVINLLENQGWRKAIQNPTAKNVKRRRLTPTEKSYQNEQLKLLQLLAMRPSGSTVVTNTSGPQPPPQPPAQPPVVIYGPERPVNQQPPAPPQQIHLNVQQPEPPGTSLLNEQIQSVRERSRQEAEAERKMQEHQIEQERLKAELMRNIVADKSSSDMMEIDRGLDDAKSPLTATPPKSAFQQPVQSPIKDPPRLVMPEARQPPQLPPQLPPPPPQQPQPPPEDDGVRPMDFEWTRSLEDLEKLEYYAKTQPAPPAEEVPEPVQDPLLQRLQKALERNGVPFSAIRVAAKMNKISAESADERFINSYKYWSKRNNPEDLDGFARWVRQEFDALRKRNVDDVLRAQPVPMQTDERNPEPPPKQRPNPKTSRPEKPAAADRSATVQKARREQKQQQLRVEPATSLPLAIEPAPEQKALVVSAGDPKAKTLFKNFIPDLQAFAEQHGENWFTEAFKVIQSKDPNFTMDQFVEGVRKAGLTGDAGTVALRASQALEDVLGKDMQGTGSNTSALYDTEINARMAPWLTSGWSGTIALDEFDKLLPYVNRSDQMSFIVNTDKAKGDGKHWQAVFISWINSKDHGPQVCFFDSYGREPSEQVKKGIKKLIDHRKHLKTMLKFKINRVNQQSNDSESCGHISMRFLTDMMSGKSFKDATNYTVANSERLAQTMSGGSHKRFGFI